VTVLAASELVAILVLALLLNRRHEQEIKTIIGIMEIQEARERELLNAARNPGYVLQTPEAGPTPEQVAAAKDAMERQQRYQDNLSKVGMVEYGD
jgi:hypothetical protein